MFLNKLKCVGISKKIISILMVICLMITICGCTSEKNQVTGGRIETTTSNIETSTIEEFVSSEEPIEDYSDFGFVNMHGCNLLLGIDDYNFSDIDNAYVFTGEQRQALSFYNSAVTHINNAEFYEDGAKGEISHSVTYVVAGNDVLTLTAGYYAGGIIEIYHRTIAKGIPILMISHDRKGSREFISCDGTYIPNEFVDWSRSPEKAQDEFYGTVRDSYRYYIKKEFLK